MSIYDYYQLYTQKYRSASRTFLAAENPLAEETRRELIIYLLNM